MSESVQQQPFQKPDTPPSALENDVAYLHPLLALTNHALHIHPMFADRMESELRHADRRLAMLQLAASYYDQQQYAAAISELKEVRHDFEISGDDTHFDAIDSAIEHCRSCSAAMISRTALSQPYDQTA